MQYYGINPASFGQLGIHGKQIVKSLNDGIIKVSFLRPYCIAYLDQFILKHKKTNFRIESTYKEANQYLKQCGFEFLKKEANCNCEKYPEDNIIKLMRFDKKIKKLDEKVEKWIELNIIKYIPQINKQLKKNIIENLWEIVCNGIFHGNNLNGITLCGQFYPRMNYFEIAFYDCGIGIPALIKRSNIFKNILKDSDYIEWASKKGTTTKPSNTTGGLGLFVLRNFINLNGGALQIISGNGYFGSIENNVPRKTELKNFLEGTLVNIRVNYNKQ